VFFDLDLWLSRYEIFSSFDFSICSTLYFSTSNYREIYSLELLKHYVWFDPLILWKFLAWFTVFILNRSNFVSLFRREYYLILLLPCDRCWTIFPKICFPYLLEYTRTLDLYFPFPISNQITSNLFNLIYIYMLYFLIFTRLKYICIHTYPYMYTNAVELLHSYVAFCSWLLHLFYFEYDLFCLLLPEPHRPWSLYHDLFCLLLPEPHRPWSLYCVTTCTCTLRWCKFTLVSALLSCCCAEFVLLDTLLCLVLTNLVAYLSWSLPCYLVAVKSYCSFSHWFEFGTLSFWCLTMLSLGW